jgi:hypothetical protein
VKNLSRGNLAGIAAKAKDVRDAAAKRKAATDSKSAADADRDHHDALCVYFGYVEATLGRDPHDGSSQ